MPTTQPRIQVTVTTELGRALSAARNNWPDAPRSELVTQLALLGSHALAADQGERRHERRRALEETSGALTGAFPPGYLAGIRADWPA